MKSQRSKRSRSGSSSSSISGSDSSSTTTSSSISSGSENSKRSKRKRKYSSSSSSSSSSGEEVKVKVCRKDKKRKKRKRCTSSEDTSESGSSHKLRRTKKREKNTKKFRKKAKDTKGKEAAAGVSENVTKVDGGCSDIPISLMDRAKTLAPMTKEEWEKQQSVTRRVFDESTGRHRLIKGDGEVIEEIVSKERHKAINAEATRGDGNYFEAKVSSSLSQNK